MAAPPVSGEWKRQFVQQNNAAVWGTGVNQVHYYYGGPDLRMAELTQRQGEVTPPFAAVPDDLTAKDLWGYTPEDSSYTGMQYDDRPNWGDQPTETRRQTENHPSWRAPGAINEAFRAAFGGAYRTFRGHSQASSPVQYVIPTETVTEGWRNKETGQAANAVPSSTAQLERQTSMQQRYQTRSNQAAQDRSTDDPRSSIKSKITGQKLKIYSGGQRHYDMLPKEQDDIPRPFYYRNAGTGRVSDMVPNTMWGITAIQRVPPPQPAQGVAETQISSDYGYTAEDTQYYA